VLLLLLLQRVRIMASLEEAFGGGGGGGDAPWRPLTTAAAAAPSSGAAVQELLRKNATELLRNNVTGRLRPCIADVGDVVAEFERLKQSQSDTRAEMDALDAELAGVVALECDYHEHLRKLTAKVCGCEPLPEEVSKARATVDAHYNATLASWKVAAQKRLDEAREGFDRAGDELAVLRTLVVAGVRDMLRDTDPERVEKKVCPICLDAEVEVCCVPCGHTFCTACHAKATFTARLRGGGGGASADKCATCRAVVRETVRMYFSF
jgi:Zinc finger, C3HC4 type (RING finger)